MEESYSELSVNNNTKLNYIGSKYKLLSFLYSNIKKYTTIEGKTFGDLFAGTSSVGFFFRKLGANVVSNDTETYSFILSQAYLNYSYTSKIDSIIEDLNKVEPIDGLVTKNYCRKYTERMYFTDKNGMKIDAVRSKIEEYYYNKQITEGEYYYLIGCLLIAADKVANTASVYGSYLKHYKRSAQKDLVLALIHSEVDSKKHTVYNIDIKDICHLDSYDIVYLDPPYNQRQYSKNYHVLNYIAKYSGEEIYGKTGLLRDSNLSNYCYKSKVLSDFTELTDKLRTRYLFMSYSNEGLLSKEEIIKVLSNKGRVDVIEKEYKKFNSNQKNKSEKTVEYLFCVTYK